MEEIVTIELLGQQFSFKTDEDVSDVNEIRDLLINEVNAIEKSQPEESLTKSKVTIMTIAALNIANEYVKMKGNYTDLQKKISKRSSSIIKKLDVD
ncbi:MAG: cell division protein ZapA [Desulfobacterales bacterium]|nr:cell division protein ZapA [Desulfobacteraceae bacterium]MBT7086754.1 cell division protein ZapA [Desulfobacterales bacterium]MBT7697337.1 cell division protein ZapA [Desulfobacterales bacterium]